ncbi:F0F1 ATP synthase subunit delta [Methyloferula stellata]|uniref:F0F1 ATP synthase subunit delta n=1 Tax=Methyloferula stellata TaxID=876270 RepID=UPI00035F0DAE|nr:F0F1 ATP synthase subunit delta [Methyloferula stellata]
MAQEQTLVSGMTGRYAQALFELAQESSLTDQVAADLHNFTYLVNTSEDLQRFIKSPAFTADEQVKALGAIALQAGIAGVAANFLKLVAAKRRLFAVQDMIRDFNILADAKKGVIRAEVTVAEPLKDEYVAALKEALGQASGGKTVEIEVKVDPAILGGIVVKLGSRMVDGSLKTKLNSIRTRMKEVG